MAVVRRDESASKQLSREGRDAFPLSATTCISAILLREPWASMLGIVVSIRWAFLSFRYLLSNAAGRRLLLNSSSYMRCKASAEHSSHQGSLHDKMSGNRAYCAFLTLFITPSLYTERRSDNGLH
jgi:hypothetical protein